MDTIRIIIKLTCILGICFYSTCSTAAEKSIWLYEIVDTFNTFSGPLFLGNTITNETVRGSITPKCWSDFQFYVTVHNHPPVPPSFGPTVLEIFHMTDADGRRNAGLASGKTSWLGDYDLCMSINVENKWFNYTEKTDDGSRPKEISLRANFKAQYFKVAIRSIEGFVINFGVCGPDSCDRTDVHKMLNNGEQSFNVTSVYDLRSKGHIGNDPMAIVALCIIAIFVALVLISSVIDIFYITPKRERHQKKASYEETTGKEHKEVDVPAEKHDNETTSIAENKSSANYYQVKAEGGDNGCELDQIHTTVAVNGAGNDGNVDIGTSDVPSTNKPKPYSPGVGTRVLLAFSAYSNLPQLMSVDVPKGSYLALNCIRFLSMAYILLGHTFQLGITRATANWQFWGAPVYQGLYHTRALINMQLAVDSFFVLSGFLVAVSFLKTLDRQGGRLRCKQMALYYFHRFWRLTPVYMILVMFMATLFKYLVDGPICPEKIDEAEGCRLYWWPNLLYINNFLLPLPMCMGWTWYLANDMQFYIVAPLFLFAMYRKPVIGFILTGISFMGSIVATGLLHAFNRGNFFDEYVKPYTRIGTYILGLWLGYLIWKTKGKITLKWWMQVIGWIVALGSIHAAIYGSYMPPGEKFEGGRAIAYAALQRQLFGLGVAWICFVCITGYGGVVNRIMSWRVWIPLSKLCYTGYLIHPIVMYYYHYNRRHVQYMRIFPEIVVLFCAFLCLTLAASILVTLTFEVPMLHLEKVMFPREKKNK